MPNLKKVQPQEPPPSPVRRDPIDWEHYVLWKRVCEAARSLPDHFKSTTNIEGMLATDIFTLNLAVEGLALVDENICIPLEIVQWIQKETAE